MTSTAVDVVLRLGPVENVGLSVDELDVVRALRVAVTSAVLGAGLVVLILGQATVGVHLDS